MQLIFWYDWVLSFFLILIVLRWTNKFVKKNKDDALVTKYFKKGLVLKIIGCLAYVIYHQYVYHGGDTFSYFNVGKQVHNYFYTDFSRFLKLTFYPIDNSTDVRMDDTWIDNIMVNSENNTFQVRVAALLQFFTFSTFIPTSLLFSLLSYIGIWKCFRVFTQLYPNEINYMAISFLYIPTVIFWGSGLGKDCVCLGSICALTASAYCCFVFKKRIKTNFFSIIIFTAILLIVKPYIAISFLPPMFLTLVFLRLKRIKNSVLKSIIFPLSLVLTVVVILLIFQYTSTNFSRYAVENLAEKVVQASISTSQAGSTYDLGITPENISDMPGLLSFFPKGVVTTLFRPWIWEVKNPAMLLSALEALAFLFITLYILIKGKIYKPIFIIISDPILFTSLVYVIIFAGLVGLSTTNFGTLVRYKLPIMPFLGIVLFVVVSRLKTTKSNENIQSQ